MGLPTFAIFRMPPHFESFKIGMPITVVFNWAANLKR